MNLVKDTSNGRAVYYWLCIHFTSIFLGRGEMKRKMSVEEGMRGEKIDSDCSFFRMVVVGWSHQYTTTTKCKQRAQETFRCTKAQIPPTTTFN